MDELEVLTATAFRPGDVVLLRTKRPFSGQQATQWMGHLERLHQRTGVEFVLLTEDVEVVLAEREGA